jgi:hypothetical protein
MCEQEKVIEHMAQIIEISLQNYLARSDPTLKLRLAHEPSYLAGVLVLGKLETFAVCQLAKLGFC